MICPFNAPNASFQCSCLFQEATILCLHKPAAFFSHCQCPLVSERWNYRGAQTCSGFIAITLFMLFSEAFFYIYFLSFWFDSAVFTPQKPRSCWSLSRYLYICSELQTLTLNCLYFTEVTTLDHCDHIYLLIPQGTM